jgi:hypothetical protein
MRKRAFLGGGETGGRSGVDSIRGAEIRSLAWSMRRIESLEERALVTGIGPTGVSTQVTAMLRTSAQTG